MDKGYVKMFRTIQDDVLWRDDEPFCKRAAWMDLILLANYKENDFILGNTKFYCRKGQHWTSIKKLEERWHWSEKKVKAFLRLLENENKIMVETTNRGSMITLVNYGKYQDFNGRETEPLAEPLTEQMDGLKKNEGRTTDGATDVQTIKNKKDINKDSKKEKKPAALSLDFVVEE